MSDFIFDRYQTVDLPTEMGKYHFLTLYNSNTTSYTKSNVIFWGDSGTGDMTFDEYVSVKINGTIYYTPLYTGSATNACCSIMTGNIEGDMGEEE